MIINIKNLTIDYKNLMELIKLNDCRKMRFLMDNCIIFNVPKKINEVMGRYNKKEGYKILCDIPLKGYFLSYNNTFQQN